MEEEVGAPRPIQPRGSLGKTGRQHVPTGFGGALWGEGSPVPFLPGALGVQPTPLIGGPGLCMVRGEGCAGGAGAHAVTGVGAYAQHLAPQHGPELIPALPGPCCSSEPLPCAHQEADPRAEGPGQGRGPGPGAPPSPQPLRWTVGSVGPAPTLPSSDPASCHLLWSEGSRLPVSPVEVELQCWAGRLMAAGAPRDQASRTAVGRGGPSLGRPLGTCWCLKAAPGQAPPVASFSGHPGRRRALLGPHWSWCWGRRVWVSPGRAACGLLVQWPEAAHLAQRNRGTDWGRHGLHPLRPPHGPCPAGLHSGVTLDGRQRVPGACGPCSAVGVLGCGPAPAPVMWLGASRFRSLGGRGL